MRIPCPRCGAEIEVGAAVCVHCGGAGHAAEQEFVPPAYAAPAPFSSAIEESKSPYEGIGGWLILVAIRLILSPILVLRMLIATDLPVIAGDRFRAFRQAYPLLYGLVVFEAITNVIYLLMLAWLLYLFFNKKRSFPAMMIFFMVLQIVLSVADHLAAMAVHHSQPVPVALVQTVVYAAIWIPYFLVSRRAKVTFVH